MPISNYPNGFAHGINVRGLPILNSYAGDVYWVDSGAGSDQYKGTFDRPFATIDKAFATATDSKGDIIVLKPGHAENLSTATAFQADKIGVAVVGLGAGSLRPTFTYTGTAGSVELDAANVTLHNIRFLASVSAVVVGINVDAANCTIQNCEFDYDATGDDFLKYIDCQSVEGTVIANNEFRAEDAAGSNSGVYLLNSTWTKITGNHFSGDFAQAPIRDDTGGSPSLGIEIKNNTMYITDTGVGAGIDLNAAATGLIAYNTIGGPTAKTAAAGIDPGSCVCFENYVASAINRSGKLIPATVST